MLNTSVLSGENASLLAMEFNRNPIVDDEAAFDIYPSCVLSVTRADDMH
jgi:hypothetical protein